jgi:hypothetical protein
VSSLSVETQAENADASVGLAARKLRMTPGRAAALTLGVPFALALIGWLAFSGVALLDIQSFPVNTTIPAINGKVTAEIDGNLNVRQAPSGAGDSAQLTGTATYSLFRPALTVKPADQNPADTGALVGYRCDFSVGDCQLSGTLTLPSGTAAVLRTGGGDVGMENYTGDLTLATGGGNLNVAGTLTSTADQLTTAGGDVTMSTLDAPLQLDTGGGNVNINDVTWPGASTGAVTSRGGDVTMQFTHVPAILDIDSGGGNVQLVVPPGAYAINVDTGGGNYNGLQTTPGAHDDITVNSHGGDVTIIAAN